MFREPPIQRSADGRIHRAARHTQETAPDAEVRSGFHPADRERPQPRLSLRELLRRAWHAIDEHNVPALAAQMSYYFILALFPFLIFLAALVGYLPFTGLWDKVLSWLALYFPREARRFVVSTMLSLVPGRKGFLSVGLLGTIWAACGGVLNWMQCLNIVFRIKETRSFWKRLLLALATVLAQSVLIVAAFGLFSVGAWLAHWVNGRFQTRWWLAAFWVARWLVTLTLISLCVAIADYVLPNIKRPWRWLTPGSLFVAVAWALALGGFNVYLNYFGAYGKLYGTLGVFVLLMTWIYITSFISLVGAELDEQLEAYRAASQLAE